MKELKKDSFINIKPFMVTDLKLKGNSLLIFALIYGITVNEGAFYGSIEYMQTWCNASNRNVIDCLKDLTGKGLITKRKTGNTVFYTAKTNFDTSKKEDDIPIPVCNESEESSQQSEESSLSGVKKVHSRCEESSHNILDNKLINNINNISSETDVSDFPEDPNKITTEKITRPKKTSKTELNEQFLSSLSEEEYALSEKCADLMIEYLTPITTTYNPAVHKKTWQADFVRRARDKKVSLKTVLMCVQYVHDDITGFEQPNNASPEKIFKKLDYLYAKAVSKKRYPQKSSYQKKQEDISMRTNMNTGDEDYIIY